MEARELRELSPEELRVKERELRESLFLLRLRHRTGRRALVLSVSTGWPKRYLGTTQLPLRIDRNVRSATALPSTATSAAVLPKPTTATRSPRIGSLST